MIVISRVGVCFTGLASSQVRDLFFSARPCEKRFELLLDQLGIGFALKSGADDATAVDEEGEGKSEHTSVASGEACVAYGCGVVELETHDEAAGERWIVIHGDADDLQALRSILALPCGEDGHFNLARRAPRSPEVEQHNFAAEGQEAEGLAIEVLKNETGRGLSEQTFWRVRAFRSGAALRDRRRERRSNERGEKNAADGAAQCR
jgi:hypothetical protein